MFLSLTCLIALLETRLVEEVNVVCRNISSRGLYIYKITVKITTNRKKSRDVNCFIPKYNIFVNIIIREILYD